MKVPFFRSPWQDASAAVGLSARLIRVLESGQYILGENVRQLENALASRLRGHLAVALNSGTDALLLALKMLKLQPGDEVVLPSYTFVACIEAVIHAGGVPVLADSCADDALVGVQTIDACITPRTRAVLAVPLFGDASTLPTIAQLCRASDIPLIEDAAQALGAKAFDCERGWLEAGSFGDISILSFYPTKTLGAAGDAGALISPHPNLTQQARSFRNHGLYEGLHIQIGHNSRMDEMQAVVLLQGLERLDGWLTQRQSIAQRYLQQLSDVPSITLPHNRPGHAWNYFVLRSERREALREALSQSGVDSRIYYPRPIHLQPAYAQSFHAVSFPHAERHAKQAVALPIFAGMTDLEVDYVIDAVRRAARLP